MYFLRLAICLTFAVFASLSENRHSVPVMIWDSQKIPQTFPAVSALQVVSLTSFKDKYLHSFQAKNILLFLQDNLSVEDLSSHPKELREISKLMETSHSLYLPAVADAASLAHKLPNDGYKVTMIEPGSSIGGLTLNEDEKNLVVVELPSTITNPSRKKALQKSDEVVANVISKIGEMVPFTVVFTGKKPSVEGSGIPHVRTSRSLQQAASGSKFHSSQCVILYLRDKIVVTKNKQAAYELPPDDVDTVNGDCSSKTRAMIQLNYKNIETVGGKQLSKVKLELSFDKRTANSRSWTLSEADIYEMDDTHITAVLYPKTPMDKVPMKKSYSCGLTATLVSPSNASTAYKMVLPGLQVEAFSAEGQGKFHDAWDCVGFFTIPIWMGIFSGFLFIFILFFGLYMLSDVKTMDRFDDPKGKHFMMVPAAE